MSYLRVWIHFVWSTKNREPSLNKVIRKKVFKHIFQTARSKGIYVDFINGHTDHVHCLVALGPEQTLAMVMHQIKGESSRWINKNHLTSVKFEWQTQYYAASVSASNVGKVREYIRNQERHHSKKTFQQEHDEIMIKWGFQPYPPIPCQGINPLARNGGK
jgi:REP element-mobilizing transposase RayT